MFTKLEQRSWIKIEVGRGGSTQECFQRLHEAYGSALVRQGCCSGQPHVENSTVQLLASLLDADHQWTVHELAVEVWVCHKTVLHILHNILGYCKLAVHWIPHEISEVQQWHYYAVAQVLLDWYQREGYDFLRRICHYGQNLGSLMWTKLEMPIKWMELSRFSSSKESVPYTMCCEGDVHCGVWHWRGNTAPCCTSNADGKCCLLLHVPAAPPSSSAQEKMMTIGSTELHHSSWQCKESHCCCHGPLVPLVMGDSGTSTLLTWYDYIQHLVIQNTIILHDNARSHTAAVTDLLCCW